MALRPGMLKRPRMSFVDLNTLLWGEFYVMTKNLCLFIKLLKIMHIFFSKFCCIWDSSSQTVRLSDWEFWVKQTQLVIAKTCWSICKTNFKLYVTLKLFTNWSGFWLNWLLCKCDWQSETFISGTQSYWYFYLMNEFV